MMWQCQAGSILVLAVVVLGVLSVGLWGSSVDEVHAAEERQAGINSMGAVG